MLMRLIGSRWLYVAILLVAAAWYAYGYWEQTRGMRPMANVDAVAALAEQEDVNVLFVLIDTLRADRLSAHDYGRGTSTTLKFLAEGGVRFSNVVSQSSWTKVSMSSMWTSTYPQRSRILRYPDRIPEAAVLPAEVFKQAGYRTVGIYRNGWVAPTFGFDQGFEQYITPTPNKTREKLRNRTISAAKIGGTDEDITLSALEFLRTAGDEKFFLYLHYMDVHQYVYTEENIFGSSLSDIYDSSIAWTDRNVGRVVLELFEQGMLDKTMIIVLSDHGEAFMEHGREGHARDVYREVTHTPYIMSFPFQLREPILVEDRVANVDLWPTVFDLLGMEDQPLAKEFLAGKDGRSLVSLIESAGGKGEPDPELVGRPLFTQLDTHWGQIENSPSPLISIQDGSERYYYWVCRPERARLYDHAQDPREQVNLVKQRPERAEELRQKVLRFSEMTDSPWGVEAEKVDLDAMQLGQLRALGYVLKAGEQAAEVEGDCAKVAPKPPGERQPSAQDKPKQGFKWNMQGVELK